MIQVPEHLHAWPGAPEAYTRIVSRLIQMNEYEVVFDLMAGVTALECSLYRKLTALPQLHKICEESRKLARQLLVQTLYIPPLRESIASLDENGRDCDLIAITEPLPPDPFEDMAA
jgi:hypothetical protein